MRAMALILIFILPTQLEAFNLWRFLFGKRKGREERQGFYYNVKTGDTLYAISRQYNIPLDTLKQINRIKGDVLPKGRIYIPRAQANPSSNNQTEMVWDARQGRMVQKPGSRPQKVASTPKNKSHQAHAASGGSKMTAQRSKGFEWPIETPILASGGKFGTRKDGTTNSGIQLSVAPGQSVRAAREGKVVFAGSMQGYGLTLILDHQDNYFTVYSHLDSLRQMQNGSTVKKGDLIGTCGKGRTNNRSVLHFEVRKLNQAVDPLQFLDKSRLRS